MASNNVINAPIPFAASQGGTGVASPTANTLPIANGSSAFSFATLTNGQFLIGGTGVAPAARNLTAGNGIAITNGSNSVTIDSTGNAPWTEVTGTSATMVAENGYIANNAALVTLTLPTTISLGNIIQVSGKGAGGWRIAQNSGQTINYGSSPTTTGVGGSISSTNRYDTIQLLCVTNNTTFTVLSSQGNLTVV